MSFPNPAFRIARQGVAGDEGEWVKHFDPPTTSPPTPELLAPTNPVPEVMAAAGFQSQPGVLHTVELDLMRGIQIPTWEAPPLKNLEFFVFGDPSNPAAAGGNFPALAVRVPRGVVFHSSSKAFGPPPHTIHWHGLEPTPVNDGVGHCSMEIGQFLYQLQPNFIGTYFYHCHRNTVQHFEFGLYGLFMVELPDAYFASIAGTNPDGSVLLNSVPIGACRDRKFRTAANLAGFPQFPGFNSSPLDAPDPLGQFAADPHAMTVPYDVEALWVLDDRDSVWSDLAPSPFATFPRHGNAPGVDDRFHENAGSNSFFAFNQHNADYWFVTGVPVPAHRGETAAIPAGVVVPAALNGGVTGSQVSIDAKVGQTILVRCLDAAFNSTEIKFPVDAVVIAFDGRGLGVPPRMQYSEPFLLPADTPINISTARRFDALVRATRPLESYATVRFIDTRGQVPGTPETVLATALIPIKIAEAPAGAVFILSGTVTDQAGAPLAGVTMALTGTATKTVVTNAAGNYTLADLPNGNYTVAPSLGGSVFNPPNANVAIDGADVTGQNFVGAPAVFAISGAATDQSGAPLAGVTISLTGAATRTMVTDASGNYGLTGLANGNYTVTPSLAGFVFTPATASVTINAANVTGQNFVGAQVAGTFAISGKVINEAGAPFVGVAITLAGAADRNVATDASGNYSLTGLASGSYTVTPSLAGFGFTPASANVAISGADVTGQNFVGARAAGTFAISGAVSSQAGAPLAGVAIALTGAANRTVATDASGNYTLTALANGNYTVTPSLAGFAFAPPSANVTISGASVTAQNFVGTAAVVAFAISGAVTNQAGTPLAGVTITLAGADNRTLVTDASGSYSLTGLPNGIYTVTPSFGSIPFTPSSRSITIVGGNAPGQNFVGTEPGLGFRREIWLPLIGKGPQAGF